jgi:hypothetical protein
VKRIVLLAHASDAGAASLALRLRGRLGPAAVVVVRPEALSLATWTHRVDEHGHASTRLSLPGRPPLESADVGVVLNRIRYLPVPRFRRSSAKDRDYAGAELEALVASWLAEMGDRVVHVVRSHPWVTPSISVQRWVSVAAAHGLPVAPRTIATSARWPRRPTPAASGRDAPAFAGSVLVAGDDVEGPLSRPFGAACAAAARAFGCFPLLEFQFAREEGGVSLAGVDPMPPLERPAAVEAVCRLAVSLLGHAPAPR